MDKKEELKQIKGYKDELTNEQILRKAINKAVKNGYKYNVNSETPDFIPSSPAIVRSITFSHDFAKALGYKLEDLGGWCDSRREPLKYIEKFL